MSSYHSKEGYAWCWSPLPKDWRSRSPDAVRHPCPEGVCQIPLDFQRSRSCPVRNHRTVQHCARSFLPLTFQKDDRWLPLRLAVKSGSCHSHRNGQLLLQGQHNFPDPVSMTAPIPHWSFRHSLSPDVWSIPACLPVKYRFPAYGCIYPVQTANVCLPSSWYKYRWHRQRPDLRPILLPTDRHDP